MTPATAETGSTRDASQARRAPGVRFRSMSAMAAFCTLMLMTALAMFMPAPFVVQTPGPTLNVLGDVQGKDVLTIDRDHVSKPRGELRMTTVAVLGSPGNTVRLPSVFKAWFDPEQVVLPVEALYPDTSDAEGTQLENTVQMNTSQSEAVAVALKKQGVKYTETIIIAGVRSDAPAHGRLRAGDRVLAINGTSATKIQDYVNLVSNTPKGQAVQVKVKRDGKNLTVSVPTKQKDGRSVIGVVLAEGFEFPVDVKFAVDGIGGPSAGMMFSLGIYDEMTPGDLTGGKHIAGTGTIDKNGNVGPIGGIRQKLVGARRDKADYFLAPADNCDEVVGHVPSGLHVVKVATFDDALHAVNTIAATGSTASLPTCEAGPAR